MKKILSILTLCAVLVTACGCNSDTVIAETLPGGNPAPITDNTASGGVTDSGSASTGTSDTYIRTLNSMVMSLDAEQNVTINRYAHSEETPMGEAGTWTIFVYLCGGEAERLYGSASAELSEMLEASKKYENLRFVVQTGGSAKWQDGNVNPAITQRFLIRKGVMAAADEQLSVNMGESAALSAFLQWGVKNHPAEKMGVVLYGNGGGSVNGLLLDDQYSDSLTLREADAAFLTAFEGMTDKFEFIGIDAPMAASLETANVLATYADYMYASQEVMNGSSWDYAVFGDYLFSNPDADGGSLGAAVGDGYINDCDGKDSENTATFSVVDLSQTGSLISVFNTYIYNLYGMTDEATILADFSRGIHSADNFGGNNNFDGYGNFIDLAGIAAASPAYVPGKDAVISMVNEAVIYKNSGSDHSNACGLSVYYPLNVSNSTELALFESVAVSPYHLALVDRVANAAYAGTFNSSYMSDTLISRWGNFSYGVEDYYSSTVYDDYEYTYTEEYYDDYYCYTGVVESNSHWDYANSAVADGKSALIEFNSGPETENDGVFSFTLSEAALHNTEKVEGYVYELSEEGDEMYELGIAPDVTGDWGTGTFTAAFDGNWLALPDGQLLSLYLVSRHAEYDVYSSYVTVNGSEAVLRVVYNRTEGKAWIDGVWGGIDEYGNVRINPVKLTREDVIVPLYYTDDVFSDNFYITSGSEYVYDGREDLQVVSLQGENYLYGFNVHDICGNYYMTDYVYLVTEGDAISYR